MGSPRHQPTDMTRATLLFNEQQREKELAEHKKELAEQRRREEIEKNKKALADLAQADQRRKVRTAEKREAAQRKASQRLRARYHNSSVDSNPSNPGNPPNNNDCKYKVGLASALACAGFSYAGACKAFTAVALLAAMPIWGWALLVSVSFVGIAYCSHKLFSDSKRRRAQEENLYHMPPPSPTNCCF